MPAVHASSTADGVRRTGKFDQPGADYWSAVERFERMWQAHEARWLRPARGADSERPRPADPLGSWRGEGERYLDPEQNAMADELIGELRIAEPAITERLQAIEQYGGLGGFLAGLEFRLKGDQRIKEKIAEGLRNELLAGVGDAMELVSDVVRYTFCFNDHVYSRGYRAVGQRLESTGYEMFYGKNHWLDDPQYKGVNTRWLTPAGGKFELQFHTPQSLHAKEYVTHRSYERIRAPETSWLERSELARYQAAVASAVAQPADVYTIDHRREGRR